VKKRKFLILNGIFLLLITCYSGWCARKFFTHPPIVRGNDIPDEAWTAIREYFGEKGFPPSHFTWRHYSHLLMHPYASAVAPAESKRIGTAEIWVRHEYRTYSFVKKRGGPWRYEGFTNFPFELKP